VWLAALALAMTAPAFGAAKLPLGVAQSPRVDAVPLTAVTALSVAPAPRIGPPDLPSRLVLDDNWSRAMVALASLAAAIALIRLGRVLVAGRRIVEGAASADLAPDLRAALGRFAARHGRSAPPVLESAEVASPAVIGALRPAILVPPLFTALPAQEQRAALLHEAAHVIRHDYASNLVCEAVSLPAAWHPATYARPRATPWRPPSWPRRSPTPDAWFPSPLAWAPQGRARPPSSASSARTTWRKD
jgi:beta-lactamase regulating signal transducer with metallopeptidase domain